MAFKKRIVLYFSVVMVVFLAAFYVLHKRRPVSEEARLTSGPSLTPTPATVATNSGAPTVGAPSSAASKVTTNATHPPLIAIQKEVIPLPMGSLAYTLALAHPVSIKPKDRVDIWPARADGQLESGRVALLTNILVIGAGSQRSADGRELEPPRWAYTLAVTPVQAKQLLAAEHNSSGVTLLKRSGA
jgi:hypothetical protein